MNRTLPADGRIFGGNAARETGNKHFCKMEIRLILFKEIVFGISLNNRPNRLLAKHLLLGKEKSRSRFFLPQVSLISILQKFSGKMACIEFEDTGSF